MVVEAFWVNKGEILNYFSLAWTKLRLGIIGIFFSFFYWKLKQQCKKKGFKFSLFCLFLWFSTSNWHSHVHTTTTITHHPSSFHRLPLTHLSTLPPTLYLLVEKQQEKKTNKVRALNILLFEFVLLICYFLRFHNVHVLVNFTLLFSLSSFTLSFPFLLFLIIEKLRMITTK